MKITGFYQALLLTLLLAFGRPVLAVETIGWEGLVPPLDESLDPYLRLSEGQQGSLYDLWMVRKLGAEGSKGLEDLEKEAVDNLAAGGVDDHDVVAGGLGVPQRVERNRGGIGTHVLRHDVDLPRQARR